MLNSRIIIKAKSLEAQLMDHLRYNGGLRDSITDELDRKLTQCSQDLRNTHRTQETDKLRRKWNKTKEEIDSLKQNVIIMKSDMRILQKTLTVIGQKWQTGDLDFPSRLHLSVTHLCASVFILLECR